MIAAESFDPRLMWDAAEAKRKAAMSGAAEEPATA